MRKIIVPMLAAIVLVISVLPIHASAAGGYYVIKGENMYHSVFCEKTRGHNIEDLKFYATKQAAAKAGLTACLKCYSSGIDYEEDGATYWHSKDTKTQNALELERFMGIMEGYEAGKEEGYDTGYDAGYSEGLNAGIDGGYEDGFQVGYDQGKSDSKLGWIEILLYVGIPCVIAFYFGKSSKRSELESELSKYKNENIKLRTVPDRQEILDTIDIISEKVNLSPSELVEKLHFNSIKTNNLTDEDVLAQMEREKMERRAKRERNK